MKLKTFTYKDIDTKCLICHKEITPEELSQMSEEFKLYPAHQDCFDSFDSADEFLAFAAGSSMSRRPGRSRK